MLLQGFYGTGQVDKKSLKLSEIQHSGSTTMASVATVGCLVINYRSATKHSLLMTPAVFSNMLAGVREAIFFLSRSCGCP